MTRTPEGAEWSGDLLDEPEMVEAFTKQLRAVLSAQADYVARIRRDAEEMWEHNPPAGYGTFEKWWRHRWVVGPFGQIQEHLEEAAKLTLRLEARYRRGRHEIPAARQAAAAARHQAPELGSGNFGRRETRRPADAPPLPRADRSGGAGGDFLDLIRGERSA